MLLNIAIFVAFNSNQLKFKSFVWILIEYYFFKAFESIAKFLLCFAYTLHNKVTKLFFKESVLNDNQIMSLGLKSWLEVTLENSCYKYWLKWYADLYSGYRPYN